MPARGRSQGTRPAQRRPAQRRNPRDGGILAVLGEAVGNVESAVQRGRISPSTRETFQAVALRLRQERE